jgi:hypothetical protein
LAKTDIQANVEKGQRVFGRLDRNVVAKLFARALDISLPILDLHASYHVARTRHEYEIWQQLLRRWVGRYPLA